MLYTILIGFIIGVLAKFLHPGRDNLGIIMTTLLGIAGSLLAGWVGQAIGLYAMNEPAGWIASTVAAVVILIIYTRFIKK